MWNSRVDTDELHSNAHYESLAATVCGLESHVGHVVAEGIPEMFLVTSGDKMGQLGHILGSWDDTPMVPAQLEVLEPLHRVTAKG